MVEIDETTARVMLRVMEDIADIDSRLACTDTAFRRHYMLLIATPPVREAALQLKKALEVKRND